MNESNKESPVSSVSDQLFPSIGVADFLKFPDELRLTLAEFWAKSDQDSDRQRAIAVIKHLPKISGRSVNRKTLSVALRCTDDRDCVEWLHATQKELAALNNGAPLSLSAFDLGSEFTRAVYLNKRMTSEYLASMGLTSRSALNLSTKAGTIIIDVPSTLLKRGFHSAFAQAWTKQSDAYYGKPLTWAMNTECTDAKYLVENKDSQKVEASWLIFRSIFDGTVGEKVAQKAMEQLHEFHAHFYALAYSVSKKVREDFRSLNGGQKTINQFIANAQKARASRSWNWAGDIFKTREEDLIAHALEHVDVKGWVAQSKTSFTPMMFDVIRWGGAAALKVMCNALSKAGEDCLDQALAQSYWVWEGKQGDRRKKGDALALCVALGDIESARLLLSIKPKLNCAYAKALVKYCKDKNTDIQGLATSAWENILLDQVISGSPHPYKTASEAVRVPTLDPVVPRQKVRL